ncbi:hypothetical protein [Clostridium sp.]|uniref:hypothetical protein n=1 Tax=Clostridium sp. TaxID=1506 RepID=UPI0039E8391F
MPKYIDLHKNYTSNRGNYQLKLPLNIEYMIPHNNSACGHHNVHSISKKHGKLLVF